MKTTVDIPEKVLKDAIKFTGAKTKRDAIVLAMTEFNRRQQLEELFNMCGTLDGFMTQDELRKMREMD